MLDQWHCYFNTIFIVCLSMVLFVFSFVFLFYHFGLAIRNLWLAICFQPSRNSLVWKKAIPFVFRHKGPTQNTKDRILSTEGCKSLEWSSCQQEMIFFVRLENLMGCHLFYGDHSLQQSSNPEIKWCSIERTRKKCPHLFRVYESLRTVQNCKRNYLAWHGRRLWHFRL